MSLPKIQTQSDPTVPQTGTKTEPADPQNPASALTPSLPPAMRSRAVTALDRALDATRPKWDTAAKTFVEEQDFGTQLKAAELILAYTDGRPVERQVKLTGDFQNYDSKLEKLLASPEGMRVAIAAGLVEKPS